MNRVELKSVASVKSGFAFKSKDWKDDGVPVIKIANVKDGFVTLDGCSFVDESVARGASAFELKPGDILISMTGYIGEVARVRNEGRMLLNQRVGKFSITSSAALDSTYLFYCLRDPELKAKFVAHAYGAAQPNISPTLIEQQKIPLPPLPTQRRIAGILSAYDELIENSQRRIKILESMARALYREWFVHFRFPGHESVPRIPSPLGEIPQGWEVRKLGDLISIDKGVSYNGAGLTEDGNPMVNLKNILAGGGFRRDATKPYSGDFKPRHTVRPGDIILANTDLTQAGNVVASAALVPRLAGERPILISHHLFAVRLPDRLPAAFIYHLLLEDAFRGFAKGYAIGTTVLGLPKEGVLNFGFALAPESLIAEFATQVEPVHKLAEAILERMDNLRRTRDLLLPRLLSGQINVEALLP